MIESLQKENLNSSNGSRPEPVAVVGMALRVPGARTLEQFWDNLMDGRDSLTRPSRDELECAGVPLGNISDPVSVFAKPWLEGVDHFDAAFFGMAQAQAEQTDPAHRIFLECVWEAMEHGGVVPGTGHNVTGVFAGVEGDYLQENLLTLHGEGSHADIPKRIGNSMDYLSLRVSYELNLIGPSLTAVATCSTSLLAVHTAMQNLRLGECNVAVAGGSRVELAGKHGYRAVVDGMLSESGVVRPFDAAADGTVFGNGVGVVVLKLLKDAIADHNPIHGVILGSEFCNDGKPEDKKSFIAPAASGQARAVSRALAEAGVDARSIGYVECHGTATQLGDPIEVGALNEVYRTFSPDTGYCALGSAKGNVGHLGAAAGVVSLIKACLALERNAIPPVANYDRPNPEIDLESSPFFVPSQPFPWKSHEEPRRAGVSAFGFGGANAHLVVEEHVDATIRSAAAQSSEASRQHLWIVSAKTRRALERRLSDLATFIEEHPETSSGDVAHTLQCGREAMACRTHIVVDERSQNDLTGRLRNMDVPDGSSRQGRPVVFLFPGQGAQMPGMGRGLYENEPVYRETFDHCAELLQQETGHDLHKLIHPAANIPEDEARAALKQTSVAQPALFVVEYALSNLYRHWGLTPDAMLGHSLGELVAACLAGVFSLEDALRIVALRSRLVQKCPTGSMAAVLSSPSDIAELLPEDVELAAVNFPAGCVVSGPTGALDSFISDLGARGIGHQTLETSHAFHSRMLDPAEEEFRQALKEFEFNAPTRRIVSNVTGEPLTVAQARDPAYWASQMRQPVRFSDGLTTLLTSEDPVFVEVGPGRALSGFVTRHDPARDTVATLHHPDENASAAAHRIALDALGSIWRLGAEIDWPDRSGASEARMLSLPTYPFQSNYNWRDERKEPEGAEHKYPLKLYEPGWTTRHVDDCPEAPPDSDWLVFADDEGIADALILKLEETGYRVTVVKLGECFRAVSGHRYEIAPGSRDDLERLMSELSRAESSARLRVMHFWTLTGDQGREPGIAEFDGCCDKGFFTLIALIRAANLCGMSSRLDIQLYTDGLAQIDPSSEVIYAEKGSLLGPCLVIPQETPGLTMRCVDIPESGPAANPSDSLIADLCREAGTDSGDTLTALRPDGRYAEDLFELPDISLGLPRMRYGGTVLITGGVGGLGLKIAEHLYKTLKVRLVLTSRWEAPSRDEWPAHIGEDTKVGRALSLISRLEAQGAEILMVKADAGSRADMEQVLAEAQDAFGDIHGVVHASGVLERGAAFEKTKESAQKVFHAKVSSAYVLEEIFDTQELDMFVYFSSQSSLRPAKGQVDYSAANAVLDLLARKRHQNSRGLACAIGWGAWREAGMAWDTTESKLGASSLFHDKISVAFEGPPRPVSHPILQNCRKYCDGDTLFTGTLKKGDHWVSREHIIFDQPVLSGTSIWEVFRAAYAEINPAAVSIELSKLAIYEPLVVLDTTDYELLFVRERDSYQIELRSRRAEEGSWDVISTGTVREIASNPRIDEPILDKLLAMRDREPRPGERLRHGPRWHCDWVGEEHGTGMATHVRLPDRYHDEVEDYGLHPALFDRSMHNITEHFVNELVPYTCQFIRIYGRLPAETLSFGCPSDNDTPNAFDFIIADRSGNLKVEIGSYVLRLFVENKHGDWISSEPGEGPRKRKAMVLGSPGALDSFESKEVPAEPMTSEQVRIGIRAAGLNFRDVLSALGQMPAGDETRDRIGSECSGVVEEVGENVKHLRPGDRVVAVASNCFASEVVADAHAVTYLPESLSFTEGASIPLTFMTVDYAVNRLARLEKGEKILIHAATGGIGLAAMQMAKCLGAEIFATAGSDAKREYLRSLGVTHVFDSRSLDFVEGVKDATSGEGVDVVLNALAGEYIPASLSLLNPFGRFLEIGKRDIYADFKMGLYPFRNNLSYYGIDLGQFSTHRPEDFRKMLDGLMQRFAIGELRASPVKVFPLNEIGEGFQYMARARHIGKIVFSVGKSSGKAETAFDRFRSEYGNGIRVADGLKTLSRLISSDATPPCVMAVGETYAGRDSAEKFQAHSSAIRPVDTEYREPRDANEETLKQIWEKTLGLSPIGIDDDFLALGGDSINAIMVQAAVEQTFKMDLPFSTLFRHPSIAKLAEAIKVQSAGPKS